MEKELLVEVNNISKKFCKDLKTSLRYGLYDSLAALTPGNKTNNNNLRPKEFWAVKEVDFTLKRGECIGLIGHNGAGKSTLLKIINGLIKPDGGNVKLKGKVGALIELGAGFNPILTGKENIYNNAAVLGFTKKEIDDKLEDIIAFSEIEEFIDSPVQNYSSGMKVRLGFAVAAHLEPDILIVDEVLAVGDLGFTLKCFQAIDEILPNTAIIFVSHNMPMVSRICNQVILMEKGNIKYHGHDVSKGIDMYYSRFNQSNTNIVLESGCFELIDHSIKKNEDDLIEWNKDFLIHFEVKLNFSKDVKPIFFLEFKDKEQRPIAILKEELIAKNSNYKFSILVKNIQLSKGIYSLDLAVMNGNNNSPLHRINNFTSFQVTHEIEIWAPFILNSEILND